MEAGIKLSILLKQNCDFCHFNPLTFSKHSFFILTKYLHSIFHTNNKLKQIQLLPVKSMQVFLLIIFYVNLCKAKPVFTEKTQ